MDTGKPAALEDKTNPDWIPNQNLGYVSSIQLSQSASSRFERSIKRARIETEVQTEAIDGKAENPTEHFNGNDNEEISARQIHENCVSESVQTDLSVEYLSHVFNELNFCNSKIYTLQTKLDIIDLSEDCFKNDDVKTCYFTGFPKAESDPLAITPADNLALFEGSMENIEFVVESDEDDNDLEMNDDEMRDDGYVIEIDDLEEQNIEIVNEGQVLNNMVLVPCVTLADNQIIDLDALEIKEEIEINEVDIKPPTPAHKKQQEPMGCEKLETVIRDRVQKNNCYVPGCTSEYSNLNSQNKEDKVYWFNVPSDENLRKIWSICIGRTDKVLTQGDVVCHKHFADEDIIRLFTVPNSKGQITVPYNKPKLRQGAVPCVEFHKQCCVPTCKKTNGNMYCFPILRSSDLRLWLYMIKNPLLKNLTMKELLRYRVCDIHFDLDCFDSDLLLKRTAAPTLHLPDTIDLTGVEPLPEAKAVNSNSNMLLVCGYGDCPSRSNSGKNVFRFPTVADRCMTWLKACGRRNLITTPKETLKKMSYLRLGVCEDHFDIEDFESPTDVLKLDAIPRPYKEISVEFRKLKGFFAQKNKSVSGPSTASNVPVEAVRKTVIPAPGGICDYRGCESKPSADNLFFSFPTNPERAEKWLRASGLPKRKNLTNMRICAKHFDKDMFMALNRLRLKPDAIPNNYYLFKQMEDQKRSGAMNNLASDGLMEQQRGEYSSTSMESSIDDAAEQSVESKQQDVICCAVENCPSFYNARSNRSTNLKFPDPNKDPERFDIWLRLIANPKLKDLSPEKIYTEYTVCVRHFDQQYYLKGVKATQLTHEAVPTKNLTADIQWFFASEYYKTKVQSYFDNLNIKDISQDKMEWKEDEIQDIEESDDKTKCVLERDRIRFPGMGHYLYMGKRGNLNSRKLPYNVYNCYSTGYGLNNEVEFGESIRIHTAIIIDDDDDCERQVLQQLLDKRRKNS